MKRVVQDKFDLKIQIEKKRVKKSFIVVQDKFDLETQIEEKC